MSAETIYVLGTGAFGLFLAAVLALLLSLRSDAEPRRRNPS